jgi:hypothetical protein
MSRLKSGLRKIRRLIQGGLVKMRYKNDLKAHSDLSIYIDLDEIVFERYFYLFVKFFHLEGYTVYFKPNLIALAGLKESEYANYLLLEKILHFRNHPETHQLIISNTEGGVSLSADYFTNLLKKRLPNSDYYVPMAMHPNMYYEKLWDIEYQFEKKQCVFFAGNFDREAYLAIKKQSVFKVLDRITIYDTLKKNFEVHIPKEFEDSQERESR